MTPNLSTNLVTALVTAISSLGGAIIGAVSALQASKLQALRNERAMRSEKLIDGVRSTVSDLLGAGGIHIAQRVDMTTDISNELQSRLGLMNRDEATTFIEQEVDRRLRGEMTQAMLTFQNHLSYLYLLIGDGGEVERRLCRKAERLLVLRGSELSQCRTDVVTLTHAVIKRIDKR